MLFNNNALFLKYWYLPTPFYKASGLPGGKEGVTGSISIATNIAISRYINDNQKKAATKVVEFITSKLAQKNVIIKNKLFSAINDLYNDPEVCEITDCDYVNDIQPFFAIKYDKDEFGSDYYIEKYQKYMFEFLYDDKPVSEVLKKIDNLTKSYYLSININDSPLGLIIFILSVIIIIIMASSLSLLYIKKTKPHYKFLSNFDWIIHVLGNIIMACSVFTLFGNPTNISCHLRSILISIGLIINLTPILSKLIINIPEDNKLSEWVKHHKPILDVSVVSIGILLNGILLLSFYDIEKVIIPEGGSILVCSMNKVLGTISFYIISGYEILIFTFLLLLIFMEWNLIEYHYNTKHILSAICLDIIYSYLYFILMKFKIKNYITFNLLLSANFFSLSITNFIFIYILNAILAITKPKEKDLLNTTFNRRVHQPSSNNFSFGSSTTSTNSNNNKKGSKRISILNKPFISSNIIIRCHFKQSKVPNEYV